MKTSLIVSALTALVAAQGIADLPACSLSCLTTAISGLGCGITDFACSCQKASELTPVVTPCVQTACSDPADQSKTIEVLAGICAAAGFPIEVPSAPSSSITPEPLPTPTDVEIQPSATGEPEYSEYPTSTATITASEYNPAPSHPTSDVPNLPSSNSDYAPIPSSVIVSRPSPKPTSVPGVLPPYPTGSAFVPAPSGTGAPTTTTSSRLPEFTGAAVAVKAPMVAAGVLGLAAFVL